MKKTRLVTAIEKVIDWHERLESITILFGNSPLKKAKFVYDYKGN